MLSKGGEGGSFWQREQQRPRGQKDRDIKWEGWGDEAGSTGNDTQRVQGNHTSGLYPEDGGNPPIALSGAMSQTCLSE